jgi:predicted lactoylglutathione lyase
MPTKMAFLNLPVNNSRICTLFFVQRFPDFIQYFASATGSIDFGENIKRLLVAAHATKPARTFRHGEQAETRKRRAGGMPDAIM